MAFRKENCFYFGCPERKHNRDGTPKCPYRAALVWCGSEEYKEQWLATLHQNIKATMAMAAVLCATLDGQSVAE